MTASPAIALSLPPSGPSLTAEPAPWLDSDFAACISGPRWPLDPVDAEPLTRKFATAEIVLDRSVAAEIAAVAQSLETLVRLPDYAAAVTGSAPNAVQTDAGTAGIFNALDFHITPAGPRLIEANTNGGGAFLLGLMGEMSGRWSRQEWEERLVALFLAEWQNVRPGATLRRVAIVDDTPDRQFLYDEFILATHALQRRGIDTLLLDPRDLEYRNGALQHRGQTIDFVYNRLTRFGFDGVADGALAEAYKDGAAVVSPNPRVHARWACKRNLVLWSDDTALRACGLPRHMATLLAATVPRTVMVTPQNADDVWRRRADLYFKPVDGHGSKGVYAGAKITRGVWEVVAGGGYVAQERIDPPMVETPAGLMKADLRAFVWNGEIVSLGARLFRGQTVNFRTPGGGFAQVRLANLRRGIPHRDEVDRLVECVAGEFKTLAPVVQVTPRP